MLWLVAFLRKKKKVNYYKNDLITFLVTLQIILFPFLAATDYKLAAALTEVSMRNDYIYFFALLRRKKLLSNRGAEAVW